MTDIEFIRVETTVEDMMAKVEKLKDDIGGIYTIQMADAICIADILAMLIDGLRDRKANRSICIETLDTVVNYLCIKINNTVDSNDIKKEEMMVLGMGVIKILQGDENA
jgi:hypothetical protein